MTIIKLQNDIVLGGWNMEKENHWQAEQIAIYNWHVALATAKAEKRVCCVYWELSETAKSGNEAPPRAFPWMII